MDPIVLISLLIGVPLLWVLFLKLVVGSIRGRKDKGKWSLAVIRATARTAAKLRYRGGR